MAESIKQRLNALSNLPDAYEVKFLEDAALADLTALRATMALIYADCVALRTKLAADIVDVAAMRTPIAATVTDVAAMRTPIAATVTDVAAMRTPIAATVVDVAAIRTRLLSSMLSPAGLAIGPSAKLVPQAVNPIMAMANGVLVFKPAATEMSALAGTIANTKYALWAFYVDSAGTITTSTKTADANTGAAAFLLMPAVPTGKAQIGAIIVVSSDAGGFIGGTHALDLNCTVIYIDTVGNAEIPGALTAAAPAALTASAPAALTASAPAALTASTPAALTSATPSALTLTA